MTLPVKWFHDREVDSQRAPRRTSAYLKVVLGEEHSEALRAWLADVESEAVSCDLLRVEALRAARRHSPEAVLAVRSGLDAIALLQLSSSLCERASELAATLLRSLDAIHLAAALSLGDDLEGVLTYDERLAQAAHAHGLPVLAPT